MEPTQTIEMNQLVVGLIWLGLLIFGAGVGSLAHDLITHFKQRRAENDKSKR